VKRVNERAVKNKKVIENEKTISSLSSETVSSLSSDVSV
jgi:hypothetical protein